MIREQHDVEYDSSVKASLEDMSAAVLYCRSERHAWDPDTLKDLDIAIGPSGYVIQWRREVECKTCGATRSQTLGPDGYSIRSHIRYPAGYLNADGGRIHSSTVRLQQMRNAGYNVAPCD